MSGTHTPGAPRLKAAALLFVLSWLPAAAQTPAPSDRQKRPCPSSAEARQFDFWVGEWDVYDPRGNKVGTSVIERIANGCGILENWTGAMGGEGKSVNFYDPHAGKWFQYWIGTDGNPQRYSGEYRDGALRFAGEAYTQNGTRYPTRLTFFNLDANTVRQLSERSEDDGKTWLVGYDFKYVRRSRAAPLKGV
ncbi:MAG: hypothetical protein JOZ02_14020 [Acidobacteria bacterium]|nr:hypothetical protein [Acidobacteriota bacterium]